MEIHPNGGRVAFMCAATHTPMGQRIAAGTNSRIATLLLYHDGLLPVDGRHQRAARVSCRKVSTDALPEYCLLAAPASGIFIFSIGFANRYHNAREFTMKTYQPRSPTSTLKARLTAVSLAFLAVAVSVPAVAGPSLDAYALSAGGSSALGSLGSIFSCGTFGPDPRKAYFTGTIDVSLPTDGPCGVGVDSRAATVTTGGIGVASSLAVGFGPSSDLKTYTGSSAGRAEYGNLGVRANGTHTGSTNSGSVDGSQAFGRQTETMTFMGSTGFGTYQPHLTIDGSLFGVGRSYSELSFFYSVNAGPALLAFRILDARGSVTFFESGGDVASIPGFTMSGDLVNGFTIAGSTTFTPSIPIAFATPTDITFGLWASVVPSSSVGLLVPSGGDVEFLNTVKLTGITVLDSNGVALNNFSIASGSGTQYGRNGVVAIQAVPEPGTIALLMAGLLIIGGSRMRTRRQSDAA